MAFEKYQNWIVTLVICVSGLIYFFRIDHVIGQFGDDAWYLVLAKSIAETGSYQLMSSPIQGLQPIYPPGFPLILALVMKIVPGTVTNLWTLKYVSIFAMIGVGATCYKYYGQILKFPQYLSFMCVTFVVLAPGFVFIATSTLMSECVFTCFLLFALVKLETAIERAMIDNRILVQIGVIVSAGCLLRSAALMLVLAIMIRLVWCKEYSGVLKIAGIFCLIVTPWLIYSKLAYPNNLQKALHGGAIVSSYIEQLQMNTAGDDSSGVTKIENYPRRVIENVKSIIGRDMLGLFLPSVIRSAEESGTEVLGLGGGMKMGLDKLEFAQEAKYLSLLFSLIILIGIIVRCKGGISSVEISLALTFLMTIVWPWLTFRFVLPFFPIILGYFFCGLQEISLLIGRYTQLKIGEYKLARSILLTLLFFILAEHASYISLKQRTPERVGWIDEFNSISELAASINQKLPTNCLIASTNTAQLFLLTNHAGVSVGLNAEAWAYWRRSGLRYTVNTRPELQLKNMNDDTAIVIYSLPKKENLKIVDLGEFKVPQIN